MKYIAVRPSGPRKPNGCRDAVSQIAIALLFVASEAVAPKAKAQDYTEAAKSAYCIGVLKTEIANVRNGLQRTTDVHVRQEVESHFRQLGSLLKDYAAFALGYMSAHQNFAIYESAFEARGIADQRLCDNVMGLALRQCGEFPSPEQSLTTHGRTILQCHINAVNNSLEKPLCRKVYACSKPE